MKKPSLSALRAYLKVLAAETAPSPAPALHQAALLFEHSAHQLVTLLAELTPGADEAVALLTRGLLHLLRHGELRWQAHVSSLQQRKAQLEAEAGALQSECVRLRSASPPRR